MPTGETSLRVQTGLVEVSGTGSGAPESTGLEAYSDSSGDAEFNSDAEFIDNAESNGEAVCWLGQVCPECGAMIETELPADCWRCGKLVQRV